MHQDNHKIFCDWLNQKDNYKYCETICKKYIWSFKLQHFMDFEDLLNETVAKILRSNGQDLDTDPKRLKNFFVTSAINLCKDFSRKKNNRIRNRSLAFQQSSSDYSGEDEDLKVSSAESFQVHTGMTPEEYWHLCHVKHASEEEKMLIARSIKKICRKNRVVKDYFVQVHLLGRTKEEAARKKKYTGFIMKKAEEHFIQALSYHV